MPRNSGAATDRYELHETSGYSMLGIGPTHHPPLSDTLVIAVRHRSGYGGRSILASRAQVRELVDWLTRWLEHGWPGVPRAEGPTSVDVIEHYRDIAVRERIAADRVRREAGRQVDAALALIPAGRRSVDLEQVAKEQGTLWHQLTARADALETTRVQFVAALVRMSQATGATADQLRAAARKTLDRYNHPPGKPMPDPVPDPPIYDVVQLGLFEGGDLTDG